MNQTDYPVQLVNETKLYDIFKRRFFPKHFNTYKLLKLESYINESNVNESNVNESNVNDSNVNNLKIVLFQDGLNLLNDCCPITLTPFIKNEHIIICNLCKNAFNKKAFEQWIIKKPECPLCNNSLDFIYTNKNETVILFVHFIKIIKDALTRKYNNKDIDVSLVTMNYFDDKKLWIFITAPDMRNIWSCILDENGYLTLTGENYSYIRAPYYTINQIYDNIYIKI